MRVLGLDYGAKTVGVSVSDELMLTAGGLEVIRREKESVIRPTMRRLKQLIEEYQVEMIVLGFPKMMNNTVGERGIKTEAFKTRLENATSLPVVLWDERLSSVAAEKLLKEGGFRREKRADMVDKMAAVYILQGYLDAQYLIEKDKESKHVERI